MRLESIRTERIMIRIPTVDDAKIMHDGLKKSISMLKGWMPWAQSLASLEDTKYFLRNVQETWASAPVEHIERSLIITDPKNKVFIGSTGIKPVNLYVPSHEIGYWVNTEYEGKGFITEAVNALIRYLFECLKSNRVQISSEAGNIKSAKVPERLNMPLEAILKNYQLTADSRRIADTHIYAITDIDKLPPLKVQWK